MPLMFKLSMDLSWNFLLQCRYMLQLDFPLWMIIAFTFINVSYCQSFFHIKWKLKQQIMKEAEKINISIFFALLFLFFSRLFLALFWFLIVTLPFLPSGQDWPGPIEKWLIVKNKMLLTKNIPERLAYFFQRK